MAECLGHRSTIHDHWCIMKLPCKLYSISEVQKCTPTVLRGRMARKLTSYVSAPLTWALEGPHLGFLVNGCCAEVACQCSSCPGQPSHGCRVGLHHPQGLAQPVCQGSFASQVKHGSSSWTPQEPHPLLSASLFQHTCSATLVKHKCSHGRLTHSSLMEEQHSDGFAAASEMLEN